MNPEALFLLHISLVLHIGFSHEADKYCRKDACPDGKRNIGCGCGSQTRTSYGSQCAGKRPRKVAIDSKLRILILREHNVRRNAIACGSVTPHQPAAAMPEVLWDNELQHLAWCNARRCVYGHDQCRSTSKYEWAGQNIASKMICGKAALKPEEVITSSVNVWFLEHQNTTPSMIDSFPGKIASAPIGHFTLMVNDQVQRIGCSFVVYNVQQAGFNSPCPTHYLVCNYSSTNFLEEPSYVKSDTPARDCNIRSKQYSCLCGNKTTKPIR